MIVDYHLKKKILSYLFLNCFNLIIIWNPLINLFTVFYFQVQSIIVSQSFYLILYFQQHFYQMNCKYRKIYHPYGFLDFMGLKFNYYIMKWAHIIFLPNSGDFY